LRDRFAGRGWNSLVTPLFPDLSNPPRPLYPDSMHYRNLGRTGLRVSVIGVGTWQFGGEWGRAFSQSEVDAILDQAAALGINLIDTAECYGDHLAERLVGDYLARRDRSRWIVATKFGHQFNKFMDRTDAFSPAEIGRQLEGSLRALRVDKIDLYQFHSGSDDAYLDENLWALLAEEKRAGRIAHLGASVMGRGSEIQAREARRLGVEALQVYYNRLDRRPEQIYFPTARRDGLGVLARVPLASGLLAGKYKTGAIFPANDVRATFDQEKIRRDIEEVERIRAAEIPDGVPMSQWAIAWCLRDPVVSATIPGCKDPAQVTANAAAADLVSAD
jgi:aryl-alcohol dehydrogenase-like predicted oxidoreductase